MSGNKRATVSISQEEYDRLRDAEGKLRALPEPTKETKQVIDQQSIDLLRSNIHEVKRRQASYLGFLNQVDGTIQDLEVSTSRRLEEVESQAIAALEAQVGSLRGDFEAVLAEQQRLYQDHVLSLHREHQADIAGQAVGLANLYQGISQRQAIAYQWLDHFGCLFSFIRETYALDFFFPGVEARYEQQLLQVDSNFQNGFFDAALLASQSGFQELSALRLELEAKYAEWHLLYTTLWESINQEIALLESSFFVPAFDLDGKELQYMVDVDFWNPGKLSQIHDHLSEIGSNLLDQEALPDIATLRNWLSTGLPQIHQVIEETIIDARIKTINSQLRINVADLVVQALQEQGFTLSACAYNDYDLRQGYGARLTNIEGNEVVIQVSPTGEGVGENELQIQSLDSEQRTEHELQCRWQEINQSLRNFGIDVGRYERMDVPKRSFSRSRRIREQHSPLRLTPRTG